MSNVTQKLREMADEIDRSETLPTFAREDCDMAEGIKALLPYGTKFNITMEIECDKGKEPVLEFAVAVFRSYSTDKRYIGKTCAIAVNQAVAYLREQQTADTTPPPALDVAERAVASMVKKPF